MKKTLKELGPFLAKLIRMMAPSTNQGERVNAMDGVVNYMKSHGMDMNDLGDLLCSVGVDPEPKTEQRQRKSTSSSSSKKPRTKTYEFFSKEAHEDYKRKMEDLRTYLEVNKGKTYFVDRYDKKFINDISYFIRTGIMSPKQVVRLNNLHTRLREIEREKERERNWERSYDWPEPGPDDNLYCKEGKQ